MKLDLEHILNEVIKIAKRTGEYIRHESEHFDFRSIEKKGKNNLVSYVDKNAEKMIVQTLKFTLHEAGFIVEEDTESERAEEYNWVVDPLDGTTNFMHGLRLYCVSIALLKKNEPILGVVYEINNDECFYAIKGGKAFLNRKPISISGVKDFNDGLYITGMPYTTFDRLDDYFKIFEHFTKNTHGLRRLGSAAADIAYVACGRAEGFFESGLHPWDVAAAALILKEAGGIVTDYRGGKDYIFGGEIIAGCAVQPKMAEVIRSYWFK